MTAHAADPAGPTDAEVNEAIARGVTFLRAQQEDDGGWSYRFNSDHKLGITALAGLALLENGAARDDEAIVKATRLVRELAETSDQTYDITLAILFLAHIQPGSRGENDDLIRRLGARLARGSMKGVWTYTVPVDAEAEQESGSRRRESGSRRRESGTEKSPVKAKGRRRVPTPMMPFGGGGDNSNTQFALLGLWAASRHDFDANDALAEIDDHFRGTQNQDGGWGYTPQELTGNAMTCAGLMGLTIAAARPEHAERQNAHPRGADLAADPAFTRALARVAHDARLMNRASDIYYLWSVERVCVALGLRKLDGLDWYARGATVLLKRQRPDGAWDGQRWGLLPDTCLALLFLRKANLAFKLDHVLKMPDPERDAALAKLKGKAVKAAAAPKAAVKKEDDGEVAVVVKQADESKFPEVRLDFEVKRPGGEPLLDGAREDFRVTEYDQPVEVLSFQGPSFTKTRETTVVLVLDHSKSMEEEDRIGGLKRAVGTFLKVMPAGSRVAVIAFGSDVKLVCPFTTDPKKVQAAVDALEPDGATRYYDAVAEALALLAKETGRRAVLAMTDGEDTFSQDATLTSTIRSAQKASLPVSTLALGSEDEIASDDLRALAEQTRGQYYSARQADQLGAIYEEIARSLGQSYSLVYRTNRQVPDGTLRPVRVYYKASQKAGEAAVYIRGMVVPAGGWHWLFLLLIAGLGALAVLPGRLAR